MIRKTTSFKVLCFIVGMLLMSACAGQGQQHEKTGAQIVTTPSSLEKGRALFKTGNYSIACPYLEASLSQGEEELSVLPILCAAQIRAGRFLAARLTITRLVKISPEHPHAKELLLLLNKLLVSVWPKAKKEPLS